MRYEKDRKIFGVDELTLQRFGRFLLLPLAALILILVILALDHKKTAKPKAEKAGKSGYDYAAAAPEKCTDDAINTLVQDYLTARSQGDAEELYRVFGMSGQELPTALQEQMAAEKKLYDAFENTITYVIPGVETGSYIAYIESQAWFKKIQTPAPVLLRAYIVSTGDGLQMKPDESLTEAERAAIKAAEGSEAVKKMNNDYRTALAKAIVSDAKLGSLYQKLRAGGSAAAAAEEATEESSEMQSSKFRARARRRRAQQRPQRRQRPRRLRKGRKADGVKRFLLRVAGGADCAGSTRGQSFLAAHGVAPGERRD